MILRNHFFNFSYFAFCQIFENFEADRINERATHIITLRYFSDLKNDNRIKYNDRIFNIKGIINVLEENRILEVEVEEVL